MLLIRSTILVLVIIFLVFVNQESSFFFQLRRVENKRIFKINKLKNMNDKEDGNDNLLHDARRLTKIREFLRRTSLNELPQ